MRIAIQVVVGTFIAAVLVPGVDVAQAKADEPIKTTLCELLESPDAFNRKIISVRSSIKIGFEKFTLPGSACEDRNIDDIWLEYGKGPKRQPTTWCCGDMVPRDPLVVVQDDQFRKFHHYLTSKKPVKECQGCYLYQYQVTATLPVPVWGLIESPSPSKTFSRHGLHPRLA